MNERFNLLLQEHKTTMDINGNSRCLFLIWLLNKTNDKADLVAVINRGSCGTYHNKAGSLIRAAIQQAYEEQLREFFMPQTVDLGTVTIKPGDYRRTIKEAKEKGMYIP